MPRDDAGLASAEADARVEALRRIVAESSATLELDKVFQDVLDSSLTLFGAEVAGLWLLNPGRHPYELVAQRDLDSSVIAAVAAITEDDPVIGNRAIAERRAIVLDDPTRAPNFAEIYARLEFKTINFVPIVFRDEPVGLLVLYHRRPYDWTPDELELCATFADQMATAIANARLFNTVREGAARLRAIQELRSRLNRIQDVDGIGEAIVSEADRLIAHDTIRVYRVDHATQHVRADRVPGRVHRDRHAVRRHAPGADRRRADGLGRARTTSSIRLGDAARDPRAARSASRPRPGVDAARPDDLRVAGPGRDRRSRRRGYDRFDEDDETTLEIFAGYAAQALVNAEAFGQVRRQQRGARAPAREPAPPARGQRAAPLDPRPGAASST